MAYAEIADVRSALLRNDEDAEGNAASLSDTKIQEALDGATAEVDAWLAGRYEPPFSDPAPTLVKLLTIDIAAYLADLTYRQAADFSSELDPVYLRYQRAKATLEKLADGTLTLPGIPDPVPDSTLAFWANPYAGSLFLPGDFDLVSDYDECRRYGWFHR